MNTERERGHRSEHELLQPMLDWLKRRRWVLDSTIIRPEFPWQGRRVDLVTLTSTGICTAYELKLDHSRRAIEQGSLNALSFDRSIIVMAARATPRTLEHVRVLGLGFLFVDLDQRNVEMTAWPRKRVIDRTVRKRVREKLSHADGGVLNV